MAGPVKLKVREERQFNGPLSNVLPRSQFTEDTLCIHTTRPWEASYTNRY